MQESLNGVIVVNKCVGMVSKDVSRWLTKRIGKNTKLGHAGTLDPEAEGVLPMLFGKATKLQDFLMQLPKTYECEVTLGYETDTMDVSGVRVREQSVDNVDYELLVTQSQKMIGVQFQIPPLYSAVKYKGLPLYKYVREGNHKNIPLENLKRKIEIFDLQILQYKERKVRFTLKCSKGTYVRVVAKDLAESVGTCGTVTQLIRTEASGTPLSDAKKLDDIEKYLEKNNGLIGPLLIPLERLNLGIAKLRVNDDSRKRLITGQRLQFTKNEILSMQEGCKECHFKESVEEPVLLLSLAGSVLGLGFMRMQDAGFQIGMKRSLM